VSKNSIIQEKNPLAITHPDLVKELANPEDGLKYSYGSRAELLWKCLIDNTHKDYPFVLKRKVKLSLPSKCPTCSGKPPKGLDNMAFSHPELAKQLVNKEDGLKYSYGSAKILIWKCIVDSRHEDYPMAPQRRTRKKLSGCPVCSGQKVQAGCNDLGTTHPHLVPELLNPKEAELYSSGSTKELWWRCLKNPKHKNYPMAPHDITRKEDHCPICSSRSIIILIGENDLATTHPILAQYLAEDSTKQEIAKGSTRVVRWKCLKNKGHPEWLKSANETNIGKSNNPCFPCSTISNTHPGLSLQLVDQTLATRLTAGSNESVEWKCLKNSKHKNWPAVVSSRSRPNGPGCSVCSGQRIQRGCNDLATTHPKLVKHLVDTDDAYSIGAGSGRLLMWQCDKSKAHQWPATVGNIRKGTWCPSCSKSGFKQDKHASFYLIATDKDKSIIQYGISGDLSNRLTAHKANGFAKTPILTINGLGSDIYKLEKKLKRFLKLENIYNCNSEGNKFDGSTESYRAILFPIDSLIIEITNIIKNENIPYDSFNIQKGYSITMPKALQTKVKVK
jgi:hypothetical protein